MVKNSNQADDKASAPNSGILAEQVRLLYAGLPTVIIINLILTIGLGVYFLSFSSSRVSGWLIFSSVIVIGQALLAGAYRNDSVTLEIHQWVRLHLISKIISGARWGIAGLIFIPLEPVQSPNITVAVLATVAVGGAASLYPILSHYSTFVILTLVPSFILILINDQSAITLLGFSFTGFLIALAKRHNTTLLAQINLRLVNEELLADLKNEKLRSDYLANHDSLTGVANRRLFIHTLHRIVDTAGPEQAVALFYIDINNFKTINDTLGHHRGDDILSLAAANIQGVIRDNDLVARIGGDEFAVIANVKKINAVSYAVQLADRISKSLQITLEDKQQIIKISASIGGAVFPFDTQDTETLLKISDEVMYTAKERSDPVIFYHDLLREAARTENPG